MKKKAAMKAMKAMKKKTVSKIARGPDGICHGAPRKQGQDRWWLDRKGLDQEQEWQDREQDGERTRQEAPMDGGCREGAQGLEDHRILRDQEGHTLVRKGK